MQLLLYCERSTVKNIPHAYMYNYPNVCSIINKITIRILVQSSHKVFITAFKFHNSASKFPSEMTINANLVQKRANSIFRELLCKILSSQFLQSVEQTLSLQNCQICVHKNQHREFAKQVSMMQNTIAQCQAYLDNLL